MSACRLDTCPSWVLMSGQVRATSTSKRPRFAGNSRPGCATKLWLLCGQVYRCLFIWLVALCMRLLFSWLRRRQETAALILYIPECIVNPNARPMFPRVALSTESTHRRATTDLCECKRAHVVDFVFRNVHLHILTVSTIQSGRPIVVPASFTMRISCGPLSSIGLCFPTLVHFLTMAVIAISPISVRLGLGDRLATLDTVVGWLQGITGSLPALFHLNLPLTRQSSTCTLDRGAFRQRIIENWEPFSVLSALSPNGLSSIIG